MERQGHRATALCLGKQPGRELADRRDADLHVFDHQQRRLHDLVGLEQSELQRPQARRLALLRLVKRKIALPEEPPEAARVHQLFFAPSLIHARMASRSQITSCFLPCGMRIAAGTFQSSIIIKLLESGSPTMTIRPNLVPFITPS